jgi:hypothetical protein
MQRHVDHTIFGIVPLAIYMQTQDKRYLEIGKMQADRQWSFCRPSICGGIVLFEQRSNRKIHYSAHAGRLEPANDVNLLGQRAGGHLRPLRRRRGRRAPDASIRRCF